MLNQLLTYLNLLSLSTGSGELPAICEAVYQSERADPSFVIIYSTLLVPQDLLER